MPCSTPPAPNGRSSSALSCGATWGIQFAADHPERVDGLVTICPATPLTPGHMERAIHPFDAEIDTTDGWAKYNSHYWLQDYRDFAEFFFAQMFNEPHSTKQIEDCVEWSQEIPPSVLIDATRGQQACQLESFRSVCARVAAPVLVIHGDDDRIRPYASGVALAELTGGQLVTIGGGGHGPQARDPIVVNRLIEQFVDTVRPRPRQAPPPRTWVRAARRPKRALYISSPIGLGHALRDATIADELRKLHPDLQIDWLAQHPVTRVLEERGERIHPASAFLASESAHVEEEAGEHDLHAFQAIREMDEVLVNNFMVFDDVVRDEHYDVVIGDEAWDIDYFLHENPERKHFEFAWMTDFVGLAPDARRWRARSRDRRRLQRRDDRAAGQVPAAARPVDLHRRPRRHRARRIRRTPSRDPRLDRGQLRVLRLRHRASTRPTSSTVTRCAPNSGTTPTSWCAWSPSAGRASAAT